MEKPKFGNWPNHKDRPYLIAGPCSAESESQLLETAKALQADGRIAAFRAGVWKPRTRPGGFQGLGDVALPWLKRVEIETGLVVITEVARPQHVEEILKAGLSMVWVGARTTVNPFLVQELAEALRGVGVSVLVKNPVSPDLPLWIGAIERFSQAGLRNIGAIHRGFSAYEKGTYRNPPEWNIAIEFSKRLPETMLLCDPSHITGKAEMVPYVSQTAMDLGYDGLVIETHPNPKAALSDADQQITPVELTRLLDRLVFRKTVPIEQAVLENLERLRTQIDVLDELMVETLSKRFDLVYSIAELKSKEGIMVLQMERWKKLLAERVTQAADLNIDPSFIQRVFDLIHVESIRTQEAIINKGLLSLD